MSAECSSGDIPPGYKKTEVGVIPEDWEVKPLHALADKIMVGIASAATHAYRDRGIVMFRNQNIKPNYLDDSDILYLDENYELTFRNKRLRSGDLLTARTGYPGTTSIVPLHYEGSQSFTTLITRPRRDIVDSIYLCYFINSEAGQAYFEQNQIGGGQKNVNAGSLKYLPVPLPSTKAEQEAIAEALFDADAFIKSLEQLIVKKRQIKQGAMQELLTGKRRLPEFGENKGHKQTEVGVIPEDWSAVDYISFGQVIDGDRGVQYPSALDLQDTGYCLFLNAGNVTKEGFRFSDCQFISKEKDKKLNKGKLSRGDVILTTRGTLGNFAYYTKRVPFENIRINSGMVILRNMSESVINTYQYLALRSQIVESQIERLSFGSAQPQLTVKGISTLKILLPPTLAEQEAIATIFSDIDAEITVLEEKLAKARQIKQGMMQELFTGRIRLI